MSVDFSNKEKQILASLVEAIFPDGGKIPFSAIEVGTHRKIESISKNLPEDVQRGLKIMLNIINLIPIFTNFKTFMGMNEKRRQEFFEKLENNRFLPIRNIAMGIKGLVCLVYYNSPEVQKVIGYTPKCLKE
jgi:hypothetical protein